jgi:hypothetical protein
MSILTIQEANSMVIWNAHPKVQVSNFMTSQLFASTNRSIISGAVENIGGMTVLYSTTGGTGPEEIVPINV